MDIQETPIWEEVALIRDSDPSDAHFRWRCELLIDGEVWEPQQLVSMQVIRQYTTTFSDDTVLTVMMGKGKFIHRLLPFKDDFKVTLYKEPIKEIGDAESFDREVVVRTYRGVLVDATNEEIAGNQQGAGTESSADHLGFKKVRIQLLDLAVEQLRMQAVGGIYREMTTTEVVQGVLTKVSGELNLDTESGVKGVDMVPGMNDQVRNHIVVPNGTKVTDFPTYIQQKAGGIYGSGLGYYFQNGIWYVYPEYHVRRFDQTPKTLTVFNIPKNRLPGIERSFTKDDDRVLVLATGETVHTDNTEAMQLNEGNGARFANADKIMNGFHTVTSNRVNIARNDNVEELYVKQRSAGLNQAPLSPRRITANPYHEISELAKRVGSLVQLEWHHADADLIYPGMPVRYVFIEEDLVREAFGIVMGCDHFVAMKGSGMHSKNFNCEAILHLFLEFGE